jgi:hypothetical protein
MRVKRLFVLLLSINSTSGHLWRFNVIFCFEFLIFQISREKNKYRWSNLTNTVIIMPEMQKVRLKWIYSRIQCICIATSTGRDNDQGLKTAWLATTHQRPLRTNCCLLMRALSDCCLKQTLQILSFKWWKQVNLQWDDDEVRFIQDQHA